MFLKITVVPLQNLHYTLVPSYIYGLPFLVDSRVICFLKLNLGHVDALYMKGAYSNFIENINIIFKNKI